MHLLTDKELEELEIVDYDNGTLIVKDKDNINNEERTDE